MCKGNHQSDNQYLWASVELYQSILCNLIEYSNASFCVESVSWRNIQVTVQSALSYNDDSHTNCIHCIMSQQINKYVESGIRFNCSTDYKENTLFTISFRDQTYDQVNYCPWKSNLDCIFSYIRLNACTKLI